MNNNLKNTLSWLALIIVSIIIAWPMLLIHIPASLLLGPMIAGIIFGVNNVKIALNKDLYIIAQGIVGVMIANSITSMSVLNSIGKHGILFFIGVASALAISSILGFIMSRAKLLPGSAAVWGLSPGAATAMIILAEENKADVQLVAFMQYSRVLMVASLASIISHFYGINVNHHNINWFGHIDYANFGKTLIIIFSGIIFVKLTNIKTAGLIFPLLLAYILSKIGFVKIELPHFILAFAYSFIGWRIGLRFTRKLLIHTLRSLPFVLLSAFLLIASCGLVAYLFVIFTKIDPLSAYLATSPGGMDTIAIIATSTNVDLYFVMPMQLCRFISVMLFAPPITKLIAANKNNYQSW